MKCPHCGQTVADGLSNCPQCQGSLEIKPSITKETEQTIIIPRVELTGKYSEERFHISDELDEDYISSTYRADDLETNEVVAMRFFPAKNFLDVRASLEVKREIKLSQHLNHPNIARTLHMGDYKGERFIAFEYVGGETLQSYIERYKRFRVQDFLPIALEICRALETAHNKNIAHRDLHPRNIFLDRDGHAKVALFGLSRVVKEIAKKSGFAVPDEYLAYEPPESIRGQELTLKSDIYSLGAILYHMLAGHAPFEQEGVAESILNITPFPLSELDKKIPPQLEEIVMRCLEKDPEERFANISMLIKELESPKLAKLVQTTPAAPPPPPPRDQVFEPTPESEAAIPTLESSHTMRNLLVGVIGLLVVIMLLLAYLLMKPSSDKNLAVTPPTPAIIQPVAPPPEPATSSVAPYVPKPAPKPPEAVPAPLAPPVESKPVTPPPTLPAPKPAAPQALTPAPVAPPAPPIASKEKEKAKEAEKLIAEGKKLLAKGNLSMAQAKFQAVLKLDPKQLEATKKLAEIKAGLENKKQEEARKAEEANAATQEKIPPNSGRLSIRTTVNCDNLNYIQIQKSGEAIAQWGTPVSSDPSGVVAEAAAKKVLTTIHTRNSKSPIYLAPGTYTFAVGFQYVWQEAKAGAAPVWRVVTVDPGSYQKYGAIQISNRMATVEIKEGGTVNLMVDIRFTASGESRKIFEVSIRGE